MSSPTNAETAHVTEGKSKIAIVMPVFNEGKAIHANLSEILFQISSFDLGGVELRFLLVDDGSSDDTASVIRTMCEQRSEVELLCLNKHFGKEAAIYAGLSHAASEAVVVMDSDLQHPPNIIPQMIKLWQNGVDVVEACKFSRGNESFASGIFARGFYYLFNLLAGMDLKNHSDFKLMDKKVVEAYCDLPERKRFFRGMIPWMGFSSAHLFFAVAERQHGQSAWSRLKLLRFSLTALTSFSSAPLHLITILGLFCFALSLVLGGIVMYQKYVGVAVSGFATVILLILLIGSLIMFGLGLIGIYIEQIFEEIKQRPIYLINRQKSCLKKDT